MNDLEQALGGLGVGAAIGLIRLAGHVGVAGVAGNDLGHLLYGQHIVGHARGDGAAWHAVKFSGFGVLHQHNAAVGGDAFQAQGAIGAHAGEHDANGAGTAVFTQGAEKMVNRQVQAFPAAAVGQPQAAVAHGHFFVRGRGVDMVGLHPQAVSGFAHRHGGVFGKQLGCQTDVGGVQVLHHHKGHAAVRGHGFEEMPDGFEPAGRGANAGNAQR